MYKDKVSTKCQKCFFLSMCDVEVSDIYFTECGAALTTVFNLFCSSIVINTVIATAGNFEP